MGKCQEPSHWLEGTAVGTITSMSEGLFDRTGVGEFAPQDRRTFVTFSVKLCLSFVNRQKEELTGNPNSRHYFRQRLFFFLTQLLLLYFIHLFFIF